MIEPVMSIHVRDIDDGIRVYELSGTIDLNNALSIKKKIQADIADHHNKIIVSLEGVEYIDSSGIGVLIASQALMRKVSGTMKLTGLKGGVKKIFEIAKMDKFFEIRDNLQMAVADLA